MPALMTVGTRTVLASGVFILSDGETGRVEVRLPLDVPITTDIVKVEIICKRGEAAQSLTVNWQSTSDGLVRFEFTGGTPYQLGVAPVQPLKFGAQGGKPLLLDFAYSMTAERHVLHFVLLHGETGQ